MAAPRLKLISTLIRKKLYEEVEHILSISRQGFDIHVKTEFIEIEKVLIDILEQEVMINVREFRIVTDPRDILVDSEKLAEEEKDIVFIPTLLINSEPMQSGYGFVHFSLPTPDALIGSTAFCIDAILTHFALETYIDIFDATIFSKLKQIARIYGLNILIDAVIQTAYLSGYCGDVKKSLHYLNHLQSENEAILGKNNLSLEKCAELFLTHVASKGGRAHSFLKSSLSYFMVNQQGFSMTRASQTLSMSRTTLLEHLRLAEQLGVSQFFEGSEQRSI